MQENFFKFGAFKNKKKYFKNKFTQVSFVSYISPKVFLLQLKYEDYDNSEYISDIFIFIY